MKTLPNGLTICNATPHVIRFWNKDWDEPVEVESDGIVSANITEEIVNDKNYPNIVLTKIKFDTNHEGDHFIEEAWEMGADVIVGSIIAAQAYPKQILAMTPAPGYERVPPNEKRMNPDKFTIFGLT